MKISDLIHGRMTTLELGRVDRERFPNQLARNSEVSLFAGEDGVLRLSVEDQGWDVEAASDKDRDALRGILAGSLPRVAWLVQAVPDRAGPLRVLVQVHEFVGALRWDVPLEIGVDERVVDDLRQRRRRLVSVESVIEWLSDQLLLAPRTADEQPRFVLSGSPRPSASDRSGFRLHGRSFAVDIACNREDQLLVERVVAARKPVVGDQHQPLHLVSGPIGFCDLTVAGRFRGSARTELDTLVAQADSYLGLWRQYNEIEHESILRRARELGWVRYSKVRQLPDGEWRFDLDLDEPNDDPWTQLDAPEGRQQLQAALELPTALTGRSDRTGKQPPSFVGELAGRRRNPPSLCLRPSLDHDGRIPPPAGYLFLALGGDETRIARRNAAWDRIRGCTNPMPQLGMLIEGRPVFERRLRRLEPLTRVTREVLPRPNDAQRRALDVALNTPDIALIQGPPGTGKTRVIAALQARLAELDEGATPEGLAGNTLLTSYQHDAVETAAVATRVLGLPAVKIGARRGADEPGDGVTRWAKITAQAVRANRATTAVEDSVDIALGAIRTIAVAYLQAPSRRDEPSDVLRRLIEIASPWLPSALITELEHTRRGLGMRAPARLTDEDRAFALAAVRSLRIDEIPFSDDGPANAHKLLRRLERLEDFQLEAAEVAWLEQAASWDPGEPAAPELLARLRRLRDQLIDRLQPSLDERAGPRSHADVERLLARVLDALTERARERPPGVELAIEEWLNTLEQDPEGCRATVQYYSMVLAATCQQSVSRPMAEAKLGADTVFRTVIVDEAARSNPLDLLIPMSLAERRIILVGDHRQLPHILEPDVERELEQSIAEETSAALRRSLFERLFIELRERERRDNITRTVTLNVQYRMHPVLGTFVSQQFYQPHGEHFESGREDVEFAHAVALADGTSLAGKVAAWIDVPIESGEESRDRSKRRPVEARRIAREVAGIVARHPELSVGVITFYAAQREEILAAMVPLDLSESDEQGGHRVRERWRTTSGGGEQLRVGTVDAFQGKEFDIVFLSLTRSNRVLVKDEQSRRHRYGFLILENRQCVAMSRQQRLLVVVGDSAMVAGPEGAQSLPSLHAFLELCEGPHGTVLRP